MLSRRGYSEEELRERLRDFASEEEINEILRECKRKNYLNDKTLAELLADKYLKKGKGYFYIASILRKRGIPGDIIESFKENFDFENEFKTARKYFLENRKKKKLSTLVFSLKNSGFSFCTVHRLINNIREDNQIESPHLDPLPPQREKTGREKE